MSLRIKYLFTINNENSIFIRKYNYKLFANYQSFLNRSGQYGVEFISIDKAILV